MKVILLFGGKSEEYEISLRSAAAVLPALRSGHTPFPVGITREGKWYACPEASAETIREDRWQEGKLFPVTFDPNGSSFLFDGNRVFADCVFPLLHGTNGEDGRVQGLLDILGIPYVGCGTRTGALGMDKSAVKTLAASAGVPVARGLEVRAGELCDPRTVARVEEFLAYPLFVKPVLSGSSRGSGRVGNREELIPALRAACAFGGRAICEELIRGAEVEYALLERDGQLIGNTVGEIDPDAVFYDYDAKYKSHSSRIFIPARVGSRAMAKVREYGRRLFHLLGCRGLSRLDFFVRENGEVVFNEINTMPGFTDISMYPMLMHFEGLSLPEVLDVLLKDAIS